MAGDGERVKNASDQLKLLLERHERRLKELLADGEMEDLGPMKKNEAKYLEQEIRGIKKFLAKKQGDLKF